MIKTTLDNAVDISTQKQGLTNHNLISAGNTVQVPIVHVKIGKYVFGVFNPELGRLERYPNYIQGLEVTKINGQVNTYNLSIIYPIHAGADPNFFEKVFASVAKSREIEFTYGDAATPEYLYRKEKGIITQVQSSFQLESSAISYTVSAVSQLSLGFSGTANFPAKSAKPSNEIMKLLQNPQYKLQNLFTGMQNMTLVKQHHLIPDNDTIQNIEKKDNISPLTYLEYLVSLMTPESGNASVVKDSIYILTFVDDLSQVFNGPYFKIIEVDSKIEHPEAYQLDIGYPGSNYVFNFNVDNNENYSIFYDYQSDLHQKEYVTRINEDGDMEKVYAPYVSSNSQQRDTTEDIKSWWTKVTKYPIKATATIKGLLRPAILMTYIRVNISLYGQQHINSGLYIVTKQVDRINAAGYQTTIDMIRISGVSEQ